MSTTSEAQAIARNRAIDKANKVLSRFRKTYAWYRDRLPGEAVQRALTENA